MHYFRHLTDTFLLNPQMMSSSPTAPRCTDTSRCRTVTLKLRKIHVKKQKRHTLQSTTSIIFGETNKAESGSPRTHRHRGVKAQTKS